ncbi:MAG: DUF885 domain-containing protein [Candidatus Aminicenantes bacterium]|nr:DUF885 domain-containing protein [Candidatus Aminicenantes bacterium]
MKRTLTVLTVLAVLAVGLTAQNAEDTKFKKYQDTLWDTYFRFFPTSGTLAGYAKFGDRLEDLSEGAIEKFHDSLDALNGELVTKIDRTKLSPEMQVEHEMLVDFLDLEFVKFEMLLPWGYNPLFYNSIFINSIRSLLVKNSAALDARVKNATERAKQLPGLIKRAKENLQTPPQIYTETALKQLPAIIDFYRTEVPTLAGGAGNQAAFLAEVGKVVAALEEYRTYLQTELLPKSTGNFRIGEQAHLRILRMTAQTSQTMEEYLARVRADKNNIRRDMAIVILPLFPLLYPKVNMNQVGTQLGEEGAKNYFIQGVFDKTKSEHATKENFIPQVAASVARVKDFLTQNQLLDLPQENLPIEPMPPFMRGTSWMLLDKPGAFESSGSYAFFIEPFADDMPADRVNSLLEEYNDFYLDFFTVQNVYPGTFVPSVVTRRDPSIVKRIAPNRALLQGWPVMLQDMLIYSGYGNYNLRMRLNQLKNMLKMAIAFEMDLNIHQGGISKEDAMNYMTRSGFMATAEAERIWNHIILHPGEASLTYIGYQEILDMEKEHQKLKGDQYDQKEFLQKLLSYGAIPLRTLKTRMAQ